MKRLLWALAAVCVACGGFWLLQDVRRYADLGKPMPRVTLAVGDRVLIVEVTLNAAQRERGLMFRRPDRGSGMLFDFADARPCFWMKNTPGALSAAWVDAAGKVLGVVEMAPQSVDVHCAPVGARYGVEAAAGFFHQTDVGASVTGFRFAGTTDRPSL